MLAKDNVGQVAFPWLQLAFVGILEVDQILVLWDRVIGKLHIAGVYFAD